MRLCGVIILLNNYTSYDHKVAAIIFLTKLFDCLIEPLFELRLTWICSVCKQQHSDSCKVNIFDIFTCM